MTSVYVFCSVLFLARDEMGRKIIDHETWRVVAPVAIPPFGGLIPAIKNEIKQVLIKVYGISPNSKGPEVEIIEFQELWRFSVSKTDKYYKYFQVKGKNFTVYDKTNGIVWLENLSFLITVRALFPAVAESIVINSLVTQLEKERSVSIRLLPGTVKVVELPNPPKQLALF